MLIEFAITNFRSIKEKQVFSMLPAAKIKTNDNPSNLTNSETSPYNLSVLKSSIIYGANASGKSNLLRAITVLKILVLNSINNKLDEKIKPYEPFRLDVTNKTQPVDFEIDFIANRKRYNYKISFSDKEFVYEALFFYPYNQKSKLFVREANKPISYGSYFKGSKSFELLNNQLLLSKAGTMSIEPLQDCYRFFSKSLYCSIIHDTQYDALLIDLLAKMLAEKQSTAATLNNLNKLLRVADTGITSIISKERNVDAFKFPKDLLDEERKKIVEKYKHSITTKHKLYYGSKETGEELFDLNEESTGTIKLLALGRMILDALKNGATVIVDELDKSLHPLLTRLLIKLFNSEKNNPNNAQLIFASHDISLIDQKLFRRDQIWLTEKDDFGSSRIYPMSDFTGISKVRPLEDWYLRGRFGGIPEIKEFELDLEF